MHKNEKTQNSHSFLALAFFRGINEFEISTKFCVFWLPILIISGKNVLGHNSIFLNILQKANSQFFPSISIILRLIPIKFETLKPSNAQPQKKQCRCGSVWQLSL
jgi:hypothetical protein